MLEMNLPDNISHFLKLWSRPTLALTFILVCWKWGDWRNWQKYYPTILYVIVLNLIYFGLTMEYPLWRYDHPVLGYTYSDFVVGFIMFPATVLLYLPYQPEERYKQVGFFFLWVFIYAGIELLQANIDGMLYFNDWEYWHSFLFDMLFFAMVRLHYIYPLVAVGLAAVMIPAVLALFDFPFSRVI